MDDELAGVRHGDAGVNPGGAESRYPIDQVTTLTLGPLKELN